MGMRVVARVRMRMIVAMRMVMLRRQSRDDFDPAVLHSAHGQNPIRHGLKVVRTPAHHHNLQTKIVAEVHVHRGADALAKFVLQVRQLLAQVTDVVIVDEGQRANGVDAFGHFRSTHLGSSQIAQQLGAGAATLVRQRVELVEQRSFDRDAEPDQRILHGPTVARRRPFGNLPSNLPSDIPPAPRTITFDALPRSGRQIGRAHV